MNARHVLAALLAAALAAPLEAATLYSTPDSYLGSGRFYGPGSYTEPQPLFPVVIRNMVWITEKDFVTPFFNNGAAEPNILAEKGTRGVVDGKLSNGLLINENADIYPAKVAGTDVVIAIVNGGPHNGLQVSSTTPTGEVTMTMDLALDLGVGEKGVVRLPFYGTTGSLTVPYSIQTQQGGKGVDQAGELASGSVVTGRIGDFNDDGWIDGTLVAVNTMPLDSPLYPGQPYVIVRHFETDIPIDGALYGNVEALKRAPSGANGK
jgi:hypothetical protein